MDAAVAGAALDLDVVNGDVWSWTKSITGSCRCERGVPVVHVVINGTEVATAQRHGRFRASARLQEGANLVVAACRACDHAGCRSQEITLRQRLKRRPPLRTRATSGNGRAPAPVESNEPTQRIVPGLDVYDRVAPWVDSAVFYGVVPHNFGPHGLRSVTERLDSLQELGITALWLAPCTVTPGRGHGYAVTDYFRIRRDYGTKRDLQALVKAAHARGIRVLLDYVPNHSSRLHPYVKHADRHGKRSLYYDFYDRRDDGGYTHYFHWEHLPNLNYDHPEVRRWMLEAAAYWVRECDVDGFRIDAAWGVQRRRPDFWPQWRRQMKSIKPDLCLLAEASARDPYWFESGFDAAYDWTDELGQWAWQGVFAKPTGIPKRLHAALTNQGRGYHEEARIFRFTNNNDTGKRFLTRHGVMMERVTAALLLTLPGIPCLYTGQECGVEFEPYRTLAPLRWADRHRLRRYYRRLIALRRRVPALHSRRWKWVQPRIAAETYAYLRTEGDTPPVLIALNFSDKTAPAEIVFTPETRPFFEAEALTDLLTGRPTAVRREHGNVIIDLPPGGVALLTPGTARALLAGLPK